MQPAERPDSSDGSSSLAENALSLYCTQALSRRWRWVCVQLPSRFFLCDCSIQEIDRRTEDAPVKVGIVMGVLLCKPGPKLPGSQKSGSACGGGRLLWGLAENRIAKE